MRLLIVSNRLPVTVIEKDGELKFTKSMGGLVSGLSAYLDSLRSSSVADAQYLWVGWPGATVPDQKKEKVRLELYAECQAYPVFISEKEMESFYQGFCNRTIWPLFHYFTVRSVFDEIYWKSYERVNQMFRDNLTEVIRPGDVVWIHDYHLMLLPKLLREKEPEIPIGFFLHIPFPSHELFRMLPKEWRKEVLEGILGADLVGFHTHDYRENFLKSVLRLLGWEHHMGKIVMNGHIVHTDTFPMGIHFQNFHNTATSPQIQREKHKLRDAIRGARAIVSIDRLDYTKGILNRLLAYEMFLEKHPQWRAKVVMIMVVVPSRIGVEDYQRMKMEIDEQVGKINGRFGDIGWTPILYQYRFLPLEPLVALYTVSDVALVTPLRDGMNLVSKEYVATRTGQTGVLILSEMAGAAKELGEAVIVNPYNVQEIADALLQALEMPMEEQNARNRAMRARLQKYDVVHWAHEFVRVLLASRSEQKNLEARMLNPGLREELVKSFQRARRRLLLLDYDGTLVPYFEEPQMARPTEAVLNLLNGLAAQTENQVVLTSGRDKNTLQEWFGMLPISLVAEHGVWIKPWNQDWRMSKILNNHWKGQILPILEMHADRLPGAFVEEKEFSCAWHYRKADPESGSLRARELMDDLIQFTANIDIQVFQGNRVVEIRNAGVSKGTSAMAFLSKANFDFVLAVGDDSTDEDLFKVLPATAYSIRIGSTQSLARFNLLDPNHLLGLLGELKNSGDQQAGGLE